jgi:8-oxo-dGTP diphosphatase
VRITFGIREGGVAYRERSCAFGIVERDGLIALVRVERGPASYFDLPGGALDAGESEGEALAREFLEETGLQITPGVRLGEAGQYFRKSDGEPVFNACALWTGTLEAERPEAKIEDDHALVFMTPQQALVSVRHEAHALGVMLWLRRAGQA